MKRVTLFAVLVCALGLCLLKRPLPAYPQDAQISQIAREAVSELAQRNYASFFARLDNTMKSTMPAARLPGIWKSVISQAGAFRSLGPIRQEKSGSYDVVYVNCQFEKALLDIRLEFDDKHQIAGLFFSPSSTAFPSSEAMSPGQRARKVLAGSSSLESSGD